MPLPPSVPPPAPHAGSLEHEYVLAAPVALAGSGASRTVSESLDAAVGWSKAIAFGTDAYYTSPCQRVRIANPVESHYGGWTIAFAEDALGVPDWIATLGRETPAEVVSAFTDALVAGLGNSFRDHLLGGALFVPTGPAALLAEQGWEPAPRQSGAHFQVAPDGHAAYRIRLGPAHTYDELMDPELSTWRLSGGPDPLTAPTWQAYFTAGTPQHLIAASAKALADPEPVSRYVHAIPERHPPLVTTQPARRERSQTAAARARSVPGSRQLRVLATPMPQAGYTAPPRRQR
ncbi:hypothetical protein GCM10010302_25260 [Streptomyces polychromogenes]|uniref:DUF317 domain-containing protein n=1 Tax=Streptomyces polychromogenes TaxID=67342 RepID=A0ABN0VBW2_9ACTN